MRPIFIKTDLFVLYTLLTSSRQLQVYSACVKNCLVSMFDCMNCDANMKSYNMKISSLSTHLTIFISNR